MPVQAPREALALQANQLPPHSGEGDVSRCYASLDRTLDELFGTGDQMPIDTVKARRRKQQFLENRYLDLLLIHWPFAFGEEVLESPVGVPQPLRMSDGSPNPIWTIRCEYTTTWKAMEAMVTSGKVRSIGVSNFTVEQLEHLGTVAKLPISVNQIELHPYLPQREMVEYCRKKNIAVMGYAPLGSGGMGRFPTDGPLLSHPTVSKIAAQMGISEGQVLIRWGLQKYPRTLVSIPKSSNGKRLRDNADVFGWDLSDDAMAAIDSLDCGFRCFCSYTKKPDNNQLWHDGKVEVGDDSDFV